MSEEWNNWPRYREKILARFAQQNLEYLIDSKDTSYHNPPVVVGYTYRQGSWYKDGVALPCFPTASLRYNRYRSEGILVLLDCLPPSISDQVLHCSEVWEKWELLNNLYTQHLEKSAGRDDVPSPIPEISSIMHPQPRESASERSNDYLLSSLRRYPKYGQRQDGSDTQPSIAEHLTYMQVLYEGLVWRNANISEGEFIGIVHATLSNLPMFQAFVTFLDSQAKKQGRPNVPIHELIQGIAEYEEAFGKDKLVLNPHE